MTWGRIGAGILAVLVVGIVVGCMPVESACPALAEAQAEADPERRIMLYERALIFDERSPEAFFGLARAYEEMNVGALAYVYYYHARTYARDAALRKQANAKVYELWAQGYGN